MSSSTSSTPVDDIMEAAAEAYAERKQRVIRTPDYFTQFTQFGGVADLDINIRIPYSYYLAVDEYCNIAKISVREFFNDAIIEQIEAIDLDSVKDTFIKKYHLRELSREKREAMIQAHRRFNLVEETLSDE
jgi:hypothetical protein